MLSSESCAPARWLRGLEPQPRGRERVGLRAGGRQLRGEALGAAVHLGAPLAELATRARELGAGARDPDLLEPEGLEALAALAERAPAGLDLRLHLPHLAVLLGVAPPGLLEAAVLVLALGGQGDPPLREPADLLLEAPLLRDQVLDLQAHLLASLEQPLGLALDLLHGLAQVAQPVLGVLDGGGLQGLAAGQRGDAGALLLLGLAQRLHLARDRLVLRRPRRVVGREEGQVEPLPLGLERLVLLRLPRLALDARRAGGAPPP